MPVASLDHEDEPGERVLGYPPPVSHPQLLEHHEDDPGRVMLRDCARIEEERPEIGVNSRGLEKFAVFYIIFIQNSTENTVNTLSVPSHKIWTMEIPVAMPSVTLCPCGNA